MKLAGRIAIFAMLILALPLMCGSLIKIPELNDIGGHWAEEYIAECAERGIVSGYDNGYFRPDKPVTRAEFIKIAVNAFQIAQRLSATEPRPANFTDITDHWAKPHIELAYQARLVYGTDDAHFLPDAPLSRQDAVLILSRVESFLGISIAETQPDSDFVDQDYIRSECVDAVRHFNRAGIVAGKTGNLFDPIGSMTRAEAVKCIALTLRCMETPAFSAKQ